MWMFTIILFKSFSTFLKDQYWTFKNQRKVSFFSPQDTSESLGSICIFSAWNKMGQISKGSWQQLTQWLVSFNLAPSKRIEDIVRFLLHLSYCPTLPTKLSLYISMHPVTPLRNQIIFILKWLSKLHSLAEFFPIKEG